MFTSVGMCLQSVSFASRRRRRLIDSPVPLDGSGRAHLECYMRISISSKFLRTYSLDDAQGFHFHGIFDAVGDAGA